MIRPKSVRINGKEWRIIYNNKCGGMFDSVPHKITVGTKMGEAEARETLLHEVQEVILTCETALRYENSLTQKHHFAFSHDEFSIYNNNLFAVLADNPVLATYICGL